MSYSNPHECATVGEAFELGRHEAGVFRSFEAREAIANWRAAASDHAETSYFGAANIRKSRAYWLGVLRTKSR
jgi:hypothetical protein